MSMVTGLLALAVWGADPVPPAPVESGEEITCEVQVLTVEGLDWRSKAYHLLKPAARQGTATIWTADRALKAELEEIGSGKSIKAPKVSTIPNAVSTITSDKTTDYVRHLGRLDVNEKVQGVTCETTTDFQPETATVREGFSAVFSGQRFDQGVMAKVKFAESHIGAMHTIDLTGNVRVNIDGTTPGMAWHFARGLLTATPGVPRAEIALPEVFLSEVQGEWLVPNDGFLLISLGVNTVADAEGKAVVQERLAILDFARPQADAAVAQAACRVDANTAVALENYANMTMPRVPDRSFPEAVDADGKIYELPPLPEAYAANDLNQISPGSPLATAQGTPITRPRLSIGDPQLARTSLEAIPDHEIETLAYHTEGSPRPAGLGAIVESFLRMGMAPTTDRQEPFPNRSFADIVTQIDDSPTGRIMIGVGASTFGSLNGTITPATAPAKQCNSVDCQAADCPFSAEGCDMPKAAMLSPATASKVEMGVSVRDGKGTCVYNSEEDLVAALKNPGKSEVKYIPLGGNLSLEIQAKVIATPAGMARSATAPAPR